ncbi:MAG TPA: hypothetical protein VH092_09255 [Urbifossiella sp.]|jgi:hypothetical protein|nr:hypothetical protein [Urbifossiella sp.]
MAQPRLPGPQIGHHLTVCDADGANPRRIRSDRGAENQLVISNVDWR